MNLIARFRLVTHRRLVSPLLIGLMAVTVCAAEPPIPKDGLLLWLRADAGIQTKDGMVTGWQDSSTGGRHAERDAAFSTRAENPKLVPAVANSHAVLRFDGSDAAFRFSRLTNIQTVFWVVAKDSNSFGQNNERFVLGESAGKHFHVGTHKTAFILNTGEASPALRKGVVRVNGNIVDPVKANFSDRLAVISMVATGYVSADQISKDREFKGRSWQGDIAEIILYSRALTDAEREGVEKSLAEKYNVQAASDTPVTPAAQKKSAAWWPRWRGPAGDGLSDAKHIPTQWAPDNHVAWSVDLAGLGNKLSAFDPASGASRWDVDVFSLGEPITTPIVTRGNQVHINQSDNAMAFEVGADGAKQLWALDQKADARIARIANSVIYQNRLYCVSDSKQISCYETDMGKKIWSAEIDDAFYAAPVAAGGYVIFAGRSGKFYVLKAGDKYELVATNTLGWPCDASPAVADESLHFRTKHGAAATTLWCVTL